MTWEQDLYEVDESIGQVHLCVKVSGRFDINIPPLSITTMDGTASGGIQGDFIPTPSPDQLSFTISNPSRMCTNITIVNDNHLESTTENFFVNLSFACTEPQSRVIVPNSTTKVTIQDNDGRCCLVVYACRLEFLRHDVYTWSAIIKY